MNKYIKEIQKYKTDMAKTVVIDLDGVLTDFENCTYGCDYSDYPEKWQKLQRLKCPLRPGAVEFLTRLKEMGLKIIIYTSRIQAEASDTYAWLTQNKVPYSDIVFGKPRGVIYIDDLAHEFKNFTEAEKEIIRRTQDVH